VSEEQIARLCEIAPKYGLHLEHEGLVITKVNDQPTELDTTKYMPDQFIDLLTQIIGTNMKADLWDWK